MTRAQRWLALGAIAAAWSVTDQGLLVLLMIGGAARVLTDRSNPRPDAAVLGQYAVLVWILAALACLPVPLHG